MTDHREQNDTTPAVAWGLAASTLLAIVAAKQLGIIGHLPDPPGRIWNSDAITSSKTAHPLGIPDGILGLASYATTITLLLAAPKSPTARRLLPYKLTADASAAAFNTARQLITFRRLCSWCTATALATVAMVYDATRKPTKG